MRRWGVEIGLVRKLRTFYFILGFMNRTIEVLAHLVSVDRVLQLFLNCRFLHFKGLYSAFQLSHFSFQLFDLAHLHRRQEISKSKIHSDDNLSILSHKVEAKA